MDPAEHRAGSDSGESSGFDGLMRINNLNLNKFSSEFMEHQRLQLEDLIPGLDPILVGKQEPRQDQGFFCNFRIC